MYSREQRPLNDKEKRALHLAITSAKKEIVAIRKRTLVAGPLLIAALWAITLFVSHAVLTPTLIWILVGTPICVASWAEAVQPHRKRIGGSEDALSNGRADEIHIATDGMVEFQEIEDEGACYAFQVEQDKIVFVTGQDFYSGPKFPSTDFSITSIIGTKGDLVHLLIDKRGEKLRPIRTISAEIKQHLRIPEHLEIVTGRLEDLEKILKSTQPAGGAYVSPAAGDPSAHP